MTRYLIRRFLWAIVLFIAVTMVTYLIFFTIPADPARLACGQRATPQCIAGAKHFLGLDKPVPVQYALFLKRLVWQHSLGRSFTNRQDVTHTIIDAAPVTASVVRPEARTAASKRSSQVRATSVMSASSSRRSGQACCPGVKPMM